MRSAPVWEWWFQHQNAAENGLLRSSGTFRPLAKQHTRSGGQKEQGPPTASTRQGVRPVC